MNPWNRKEGIGHEDRHTALPRSAHSASPEDVWNQEAKTAVIAEGVSYQTGHPFSIPPISKYS